MVWLLGSAWHPAAQPGQVIQVTPCITGGYLKYGGGDAVAPSVGPSHGRYEQPRPQPPPHLHRPHSRKHSVGTYRALVCQGLSRCLG